MRTATTGPNFGDCRRAARSVRGSEHGRDAVAVVRPRGMVWFLRSRAPLSVVLYRALLEDRLLWGSADGFALLERPSSPSDVPVPSAGRVRWLRWLDESWDLLWLLLPPVLLFATAAVLLPFRSAHPIARILVLASLATFALGMTAAVLLGVRWLYRVLVQAGEAELSQLALGQVRSRHWTMILCHVIDPDQVEVLLDGLWNRGDVVGPVLQFQQGVTSSAARAVLRGERWAQPMAGTRQVVLLSGDGDWTLQEPEPASTQAVRGIPLMLGAVVFTLASAANLVAGWEREACAGRECAGRPATYGDALYWLLNRLSGGDPEGLGARTFEARSIGLAFTLLSVVVIGGVVAGLLQQSVGRAQRAGSELVLRQNERGRTASLGGTAGAEVPGPSAVLPAGVSEVPARGARVATAGVLTAGALIGAVLGRWAGRRHPRRPGGREGA